MRGNGPREQATLTESASGGREGPAGGIRGLVSTFGVACPECGGAMACTDLQFAGMPIFAQCACPACGAVFKVDWPAGHALLHPTMLRADTGEAYVGGREWYPRVLQRVLASQAEPVGPVIDVRRRPPSNKSAMVVNCIDYVYGHCVLKLLSAATHLSDADVDLVVIAPKNISWLIPAKVHTVIELDLRLGDGDRWIDGLDATVKKVLEAYETVRIAPTPSQPRLTAADLSAALPGTPFDLWSTNDDQPQVTLLLREDRPWRRSSKRLDRLQPVRLLPARLRRGLAIRIQNRRVAAVVRQVHAVLPQTRFVAIGEGRSGRLPAGILDLRRTEITVADELDWLAEYERTTVLVGVHGSHMLIPSALAGAVINLLPQTKLANVTQDLLIPADTDEDPKQLLFRQRIIPERSTPDTISEIIVSLLCDRHFHHRNVIENQEADGQDWARPVHWRPLDPPEH